MHVIRFHVWWCLHSQTRISLKTTIFPFGVNINNVSFCDKKNSYSPPHTLTLIHYIYRNCNNRSVLLCQDLVII